MSEDNKVVDINDQKEEELDQLVVPDIHNMKLHDYIRFNGANVLRVPGGWLYSIVENYDGVPMALPPAFIPYSEEFKVLN